MVSYLKVAKAHEASIKARSQSQMIKTGCGWWSGRMRL